METYAMKSEHNRNLGLLHYYNENGTQTKIEDSRLLLDLGRLIDADDLSKGILFISAYKTPVDRRQFSMYDVYHMYVVIETNNWYYSIETTMENVTMRRSKSFESIKDYRMDGGILTKRNVTRLRWSPLLMKKAKGKGNVQLLIEHLYVEDYLHRCYHLLVRNCQHQARLIFNSFNSEGMMCGNEFIPNEVYFKMSEDQRASRCDALDQLKPGNLPIVFNKLHDIDFVGVQLMSVFDGGKAAKIMKCLQDAHLLSDNYVVSEEISAGVAVHTPDYLESLKSPATVAQIADVLPLALLPHIVIDKMVLKPLRFQTAATHMAARLALRYGWAINLGGGFHHASSNNGAGGSVYADISIAIKLLTKDKVLDKTVIVDLNAHQGTGYERDFLKYKDVHILDMYNRHIDPHDEYAKKAIRQRVELRFYTTDEEYMPQPKKELEKLERMEKVLDAKYLLIYNAGTDTLDDDTTGLLSLTPEGIVKRDQMVFETARNMRIPIVMLTSCGYQPNNAEIVAKSILNLRRENLIGETKRRENDRNCSIGLFS